MDTNIHPEREGGEEMPARHNSDGEVSESQRRAAEKYQSAHIQQRTLKLNVRTDMDIIKRLYNPPGGSINGYIKKLIREDIARAEQEKEKENPGNNE